MKKTFGIEVEKIIKPIRTSDGAGVKLKINGKFLVE